MRFLFKQLWPNCFHKSYTITISFYCIRQSLIIMGKGILTLTRMMKSLNCKNVGLVTWLQRHLIGSQWIFEARMPASGSALEVNNKENLMVIFAGEKSGTLFDKFAWCMNLIGGQIDVVFLKRAWQKGWEDVIKQGGLINTCHGCSTKACSKISAAASLDLFKLRLWCVWLTSCNLLSAEKQKVFSLSPVEWKLLLVP